MKARASIIAHRGASGYLPEHTSEAKTMAHAMGADYIEQDLVATRDSELIVMHDLFLDAVTDVAKVFPGRARSDGHYYAIDFDLAEIRALSVVERRREGTDEPVYPSRFDAPGSRFRISTLGEEIALIHGLNKTCNREAGIYPEIKEPRWHAAHGIDLAALVLEELERHGYRDTQAPIFVQCFDTRELRRMRDELGTKLPLVQLLPARDAVEPISTKEGFGRVAEYAAAVALPYEMLVERAASGAHALRVSSLVPMIRSASVALHAYTLRRDHLPEWAPSFEDLLRFLLADAGIDALFCDHPDIAVGIRNSLC